MKRRQRTGKTKTPESGARPQPFFPITETQISVIEDPRTHEKRYQWRTVSGRWIALQDMGDYHLRQVKTALENQGKKFTNWWYLIDQEQRKRMKGLTSPLTVKTGGGREDNPEAEK